MSSRKNNRCRVVELGNVDENIEIKRRPYTRSQRMKINTLNDDCLLKLLSYLSASDLSALKMTCSRFAYVADTIFEKKHLNDSKYEIYADDGESNAAIVKQFGHLMVELWLFLGNISPASQGEYLSLLNYCPALQSLTISKCDFEKISIDSNFIETPKLLSSLLLIECSGTTKHLTDFLSFCDLPKLKGLFIFHMEKVSDDILVFIADRMRNLKLLCVRLDEITASYAENFLEMENLRKINHLYICLPPGTPVVPFVNALPKIESLKYLGLFTDSILDEQIANALNNLSKDLDVEVLFNGTTLTD